ncbi:hypothetical protein GDO78_004089 [Eleutherodactylus coqui]|uniref:Secreted protein n=1 Tax=Eleutherodactylus coqui TaxID=57060 RepID=A0A8J6ER45_ELECQ|nr:hypothetical protein GDO78_004089 [Eleutherodactylus coqui]
MAIWTLRLSGFCFSTLSIASAQPLQSQAGSRIRVLVFMLSGPTEGLGEGGRCHNGCPPVDWTTMLIPVLNVLPSFF